MSWYHESIVLDNSGYPEIEYRIIYTSLLFHIRKLEKEQVKIVSNINLSNTMEDVLERTNFLE